MKSGTATTPAASRATMLTRSGPCTRRRRPSGDLLFDDGATVGFRAPSAAMPAPFLRLVEAEVGRDGRASVARRYHLSSASLTAAAFAAALRAHWGIEIRLHRVMDVVFHDDLMRLRTGAGPTNMATIRHAALNIVKGMPDKASREGPPQDPGRDHQDLLAALTQSRQ